MILGQNKRCYQANDKLDKLKTLNLKKKHILQNLLEFCSILQLFSVFCSIF
jgi:hypothetical protein